MNRNHGHPQRSRDQKALGMPCQVKPSQWRPGHHIHDAHFALSQADDDDLPLEEDDNNNWCLPSAEAPEAEEVGGLLEQLQQLRCMASPSVTCVLSASAAPLSNTHPHHAAHLQGKPASLSEILP